MLLKAYVKTGMVVNAAKARLQQLRDDESGASLIEYSLLIGLISVVIVGAIVTIGTTLNGKWTSLNTTLAG